MKIAYYMPFKPLGHRNPSGDLVTGTEIHNRLNTGDLECRPASGLRCRWIYLKPWRWPGLVAEEAKALRFCRDYAPDLWLTYHSYYKAPDLLGPRISARLGIPYVIFQGIYSTKRRKKLKSRIGFYLNRKALTSAQLVFTNKLRDRENLLRLLPENRVCYLPPGIHTRDFRFDPVARNELRTSWGIAGETVIMTAAMFRPGVKTKGLKKVIESCAELAGKGRDIRLIIAGDGTCRSELETLASRLLPGRALFLGQVERSMLHSYYSAADLFAFPGIEESLGMVYLEAQSCGLPVVAFGDWGGGEAVISDTTGLLSPAADPSAFTTNIDRLIQEPEFRTKLGEQAANHVRDNHELDRSYNLLEEQLRQLARPRQGN